MATQHTDARWMCPSRRHVLGQVVKVGPRRQLMLYRSAVDLDAPTPAQVDVIAAIVGEVIDVRCSVCGECRTWVPGQADIDALIGAVQRMRHNGAAALEG